MVRLFFTFGSDPKFPYGPSEFVEVDGENEKQCLDLFNVVHPPWEKDGPVNCAYWYLEKDFISVYRRNYRFGRPKEIISIRADRPKPPVVLRLSDIMVGDLVWIEDRKEDVWERCTGYAECTDDASIKRSNKNISYEFYGCGNYAVYTIKRYGETWRCWSDRPGLFLREAERWKEPDQQESSEG